MALKYAYLVIVLVVSSKIIGHDSSECMRRYFNSTDGKSFVCVCNSAYCDTIESVDKDDPDTTYQEFVTDKEQYRLNKFKIKFDAQKSKTSRIDFKIDRSKTYQSIIGFGGAITDAAGYNIYKLSELTRKYLINSYYGVDGIEYNLLRVPIGGADFSTRAYSYDDFPNDINLTNFSLSIEDLAWKIPFIKIALDVSQKSVKLFSSAWSAPPWMKTNNDFKGKGTLKGPPGGTYYQIWANYYVRFFQEYQKHNIKFWAVTTQNEPTSGLIIPNSFNCMGFTPIELAIFVVENLGPTLEKNGLSDIKILIFDDQRPYLPVYAELIMKHSKLAEKYVSGIAIHWYLDEETPADFLDFTHNLLPNLFILGTEACSGAGTHPNVDLGGFSRAQTYVKYIIQDLNHWVTGWTEWNLALDLAGGPNWAKNFADAPIIVNQTADEFYREPMFYALGHFSKYLPENSTRIGLDVKKNSASVGKMSYVCFNNQELRQTTFIILNE